MESFSAKSPEASQLRRRRYELVRGHSLPADLIGGSLCYFHRRCGKANCRCAKGRGHPLASITFSRHGHRRVERVPVDWLNEVEQAVLRSQAYMEAVREVMAINLKLLAQTRQQLRNSGRTSRSKKSAALDEETINIMRR